jgi:nucleoid DNA-binding protein
MTKTELVASVASAVGAKKELTAEIVNRSFREIAFALSRGQKVQILPFGSFTIQDRAARSGRNPRTGEPLEIPAKRVIKFRPASMLRSSVDGSPVEPQQAETAAKPKKKKRA